MTVLVNFVAGLLAVIFVPVAHADVLKVTGEYRLAKIETIDQDSFRVTFESKTQTGRFDKLVLETPHVHLNLTEGKIYRISAEAVKENGPTADLSQVLLFLATDQDTTIPVWLISKNFSDRPLRGARYLEMHSPTSDFLVL